VFMGHSECVTDIQGWKRSVQAAQSGRTGPQSVTERSARREKLCTYKEKHPLPPHPFHSDNRFDRRCHPRSDKQSAPGPAPAPHR